MQTGAITGYIDAAQLALYAFWIFFAGLIYYLRREDKREGYPCVTDKFRTVQVQGWPAIPSPKVFRMQHGDDVLAPGDRGDKRPIALAPHEPWFGAAWNPTGDPMRDGVGPASYAERADVPDMTFDEEVPKIVPLRADPSFFLATEDPDPRGMTVMGADGRRAGTVVEVWIDRSEVVARYLEVELDGDGRRVLLPLNLSQIDAKRRRIAVQSILGHQFAGVPELKNPDLVTLLEEDRIVAYYGGGKLYATPARLGPVL